MDVTSLYNAEFMDHVAHPDYKYQMENPTCTHEGVNPSCGDELKFSVRLADDGTIDEAAFTGHGCAISQASADIMSDLMVGRNGGQDPRGGYQAVRPLRAHGARRGHRRGRARAA